MVFAARAADDIKEHLPTPELMHPVAEPNGLGVADPTGGGRAPPDHGAPMSAWCATRRVSAGRSPRSTRSPRATRSMRFRNMLTTAKLIAAAALMRTESRGGHYRSDFPEPDPAWRHRTFITLDDAERIAGGGAVEHRVAVGA